MTTFAVPIAAERLTGVRGTKPRARRPVHILHVEDNKEHAAWIRDLISEGLAAEFELTLATSLENAIDQLKKQPVDLILLDLGLPDLSGYKCQLIIHYLAGGIPVVILTGDDRSTTRELALLSGAATVVLKTEATPTLLAHAIRGALAHRPPEAAAQPSHF